MTNKKNKVPEGINGVLNSLRATVRLQLILKFFELALFAALSIVLLNFNDRINEQGDNIESVKTYVDSLQTPEASRSQQIILYKIFLAQCEGRGLSGNLQKGGDESVEACAKRLFLAQPQLPSSDIILPNENGS